MGAHIWPCGLLLAAFLRRSYAYGDLKEPKTLELGSGTGLVGLVAAAHGAQAIVHIYIYRYDLGIRFRGPPPPEWVGSTQEKGKEAVC